jgi:hypothetical protein
MATYVGLVIYFFVSIFAVPFLLAFILDKFAQRAAQRQAEAIQQAYAGSPDYRRQRLLALKHTWAYTHKVRRRDQPELAALLHALQLYGEPCWWCAAPALEPWVDAWHTPEILPQCSRCGWDITTP